MSSSSIQILILILLHQLVRGSDEMHHLTKKIICGILCQNKNSTQFCPCNYVPPKEWRSISNEYAPKLLCKSNSTVSYRWGYHNTGTYSYVAEIRNIGSKWIYPDQIINYDTLTIWNLKSNTTYDVRTWAILMNSTVIGPTVSLRTTTSANGVQTLAVPVKNIRIVDYTFKKHTCTALMQWAPATDLSCYYSIMWVGESVEERLVDNPAMLFLLKIENLEYNRNYTLQIRAKQRNVWNSESSPTNYTIRTPSCLEVYSDLNICPPDKPEGVNITYTSTGTVRNFEFNFDISWIRPKLLPELYEITLVPLIANGTIISVNISGEKTSTTLSNVKVYHLYYLSMRAFSAAGWSDSFEYHGDITYSDQKSIPIFLLVAIVIGLFIIIALLTGIYIYRRLEKQRRDGNRRQYFSELEQNVSLNLKTMIVDYVVRGYVVDEWEIKSNDLFIDNVLGHGAFGIVKHGWVKTGNIKTEAAVKMLKNSPSTEEINQFLQEMEIMKTVGKHPHLVSLLGCCINSDLGPLLITEFCSRGDLQTYLRNIWEKLSDKQTSLTAVNATICKISYENCKNNGQHFINKLYDLNAVIEDVEIDFQLKDLISIARQVALGMEYLASLKVLHRDLAARNVLLCEDKTAKVSDFGLSRDVYNDNIYCKMAGGKLPLRWMAIESLTHQRYTTQSDVWSFGVLLWEIVSLGATPYPEIENECLLKLLKSGYRMESPLNCPPNIYEIMQLCWKMVPKDRPSFTEVRKMLEAVLESGTEYLNLDMHSYTRHEIEDFKKRDEVKKRDEIKKPEKLQLQIIGGERYL